MTVTTIVQADRRAREIWSNIREIKYLPGRFEWKVELTDGTVHSLSDRGSVACQHKECEERQYALYRLVKELPIMATERNPSLPRRLGMYDHLNSDPVQLPISMDSLARIVATENYGLQRFLSAIVRIRRAVDEDFRRKHPGAPPDEHTMLTEAIAAALEKGGY